MEIDPNHEHVAFAPVVTARILIVEDELIFAKAVSRRLEREGYTCRAVASLGDAERALSELSPDLVLLDMRLPDGSGLDFLERLRGPLGVITPVIVMTAYGEVDDAVRAMKLSASDYLKKPVDLDELHLAVQKVLANQRISNQLELSRAREARGSDVVSIIGDSSPMRRLRQQIEQIARLCGVSDAPAPTVLITGETGTGKDITARMLHQMSGKKDKPFVHVDCASLPKDLIEAELFGHVKGAFTNAHVERTGLIEMAEDGVVFLDEIGELPAELQAKLLAVLERRRLRRVGSSRERQIDAWFIAATNRAVDDMVANGTLRSDLYFRLNVLSLKLPPLRERADDIVLLGESFGEQIARRYGIGAFQLSPAARQCLQNYSWPGNVRELRHVIERATLLSGDGTVTEEALALPSTDANSAALNEFINLTLDEAERLLIIEALKRSGDNISAAARRLGITRMAMRYRMKKHRFA
ncbi:MAG: sigma-54-dependent Fis family transcriptional regulator [Proteobacteria bacterium]|nr:MAG: sigma-54-dependent Fis family transcriptional regulator [Pseudomonadota bacterium]